LAKLGVAQLTHDDHHKKPYTYITRG